LPADYWELTDVIAVVSKGHKRTGSTEGHALAGTSVLQQARVEDAPERIARCKDALRQRDFKALAEVVELDSNIMHAVMMTSVPALFYWQPETLAVMDAVRQWRSEGIDVLYTIDAGPNVHCICAPDHAHTVYNRLKYVNTCWMSLKQRRVVQLLSCLTNRSKLEVGVISWTNVSSSILKSLYQRWWHSGAGFPARY